MTIKHLSEKHLSDMEIQQFLLNETALASYAYEHIKTCEHCNAKLETYRLLFTGIHQEEKPSFDFDLSQRVLRQIKESAVKTTSAKSFIWSFIIAFPIIIFITGILFRNNLSSIFAGISTIAFYMIIVTAFVLMFFQAVDLYRQYQRQMKALSLT